MDCQRFHRVRTDPGNGLLQEMNSWEYKHRGHRIEFTSPRRIVPRDLDDSEFERRGAGPWWLERFRENANFQISFVASANLTFTSLNSLASSSTLLAGASALAIDNGASGAPLEIGISALIKNHSTAPSANTEIDVYAYTTIDDTPTYPDTLLGTDAAKTITTANMTNSGLRLLLSMNVATTANQVNPMAPVALAAAFGGWMPRLWSIFVVHNMGQIVNASGNQVTYKGLFEAG